MGILSLANLIHLKLNNKVMAVQWYVLGIVGPANPYYVFVGNCGNIEILANMIIIRPAFSGLF